MATQHHKSSAQDKPTDAAQIEQQDEKEQGPWGCGPPPPGWSWKSWWQGFQLGLTQNSLGLASPTDYPPTQPPELTPNAQRGIQTIVNPNPFPLGRWVYLPGFGWVWVPTPRLQ